MSTLNKGFQRQIPTEGVAVALLAVAGAWLAAAALFVAEHGWRPVGPDLDLAGALIVMILPSICFGGGLIVADARKRAPLTRLQRCALAAIILPVTLGTVLACWIVKGMI